MKQKFFDQKTSRSLSKETFIIVMLFVNIVYISPPFICIYTPAPAAAPAAALIELLRFPKASL